MVNYSGSRLESNDKYTIYSASSQKKHYIDSYFVALYNQEYENYSVCLGLPLEDMEYGSKEKIVKSIDSIVEDINDQKVMYVLPVLPREMFLDEDNLQDDKAYKELMDSLILLLEDIFNLMIEKGKKMEQVVYMAVQNDYDEQFIDWINTSYVRNNPQYLGIFRKFPSKEKNKQSQDEFEEDNLIIEENIEQSVNQNLINQEINKPKTRVLVPDKNNGFSNFYLLITLLLSLVIGISIAYLLIK